MKRIKMSDVADRLGVSPTTVSLALNNHPRISESTKMKVMQACQEMGYHPDPIAQTLAHKGVHSDGSRFLGTLAVLEGGDRHRMTKNHSQRKFWDQALENTCLKTGYRVDRFVVGNTEREQRALNRILQARGIQGLIIYGHNHEVHQWALDWDNFAAVAYSGSLHEHFIHNVMSSSFQDVYDAVIRLQQMGYRRPGYFMDNTRFDYWDAGFSYAFGNGATRLKTTKLILEEDLGQKDREARLLQWIDRYQPDVLVTYYSEFVLKTLEKKGIRIPEDIGYFCLDVWESIQRFSGLTQSREAANQVEIDLLHGMLTRSEFGPPQNPFCIQIPSAWNEGETLKRVLK